MRGIGGHIVGGDHNHDNMPLLGQLNYMLVRDTFIDLKNNIPYIFSKKLSLVADAFDQDVQNEQYRSKWEL